MANICSNCYNNCTEITSDKCVKYTGLDIEILGIRNGDSINYVTSAIAGWLVSTLDASGIKYELNPENVCDIISNELDDCGDITQQDISNALAAAICALDTRVKALENFNTTLEAAYTPNCVPGIAGTEGTHAVVQAVINQLCTVTTDLDALELNVSTNYVLISEIDQYIANYLASQSQGSNLQKEKMVPYTVVEYYGPLNVFDATGAGLNEWVEIYLCNGENGTPDKRGRIAVGTTNGMGGGTFPTATDPLISGNPTYSLYTLFGSNTVTLTEGQIPSHTHIATSTDNGHTHTALDLPTTYDGLGPFDSNAGEVAKDTVTTQTGFADITTLISPTGGGQSHNNVPPVLACHYIMYIPTV